MNQNYRILVGGAIWFFVIGVACQLEGQPQATTQPAAPPSITAQPQNQTVTAPATAMFSQRSREFIPARWGTSLFDCHRSDPEVYSNTAGSPDPCASPDSETSLEDHV